ncbi:MAG: CBS domain-containing protein, partial [Actinomycetia bacterium]|nr:CBS domain-containing protein [Actinomycetes bacterium]
WLHALGQRPPVVPVVDGNDYLGLCSVHDAARIDLNHWDELSVIEIIDAEAPVGRPSWSIRDAVASMGANDSELLAIVDEQTGFIGLVRDSEIVKLDEILVETESTKANE